MKKSIFIITLSVVAFSCQKSAQVFPCNQNLIINGVSEGFCLEENYEFNSQLVTSDSLYIQFSSPQSPVSRSSANYLAYSISLALTPPESTDSDGENKFFNEVFQTMTAETLQDFDIKGKGGFALEVWDREGNYFSTEYGVQLDGSQMKISWTTLTLQSSESPNQSFLFLGIIPTAPITIWNEDNSKNLAVELNQFSGVVIHFDQFK